jgi:methyl-accepting chemotaxis protein
MGKDRGWGMKWFRDLSIGGKLLIGFASMIVLLVAIGITGARGIDRIQVLLDDVVRVDLPSMDYLMEADRDLQQLLVAERSMIFAVVGIEVFEQLREAYNENL